VLRLVVVEVLLPVDVRALHLAVCLLLGVVLALERLLGKSSLASIDSFRVDVSSAGASSSSASAPSAGSSRSGFCSISVRMRSTSSSRESWSSLIACCS